MQQGRKKMVYFKCLSWRVDSGWKIRCLRLLVLGNLRLRKSCSGFRDKKTEQDPDLVSNLHDDTVLTMCLLMNAPIVTSKLSGAIDKIGRGFWNSWAPGAVANHTWCSVKSNGSQDKADTHCKKVKVKWEPHFCSQTDDLISLQPEILSRNLPNFNLKYHL